MVLLRPPRAVNSPMTVADIGLQALTTSAKILLTAFS